MNKNKRKGVFRALAATTLSAVMLMSAGCGKPNGAGGPPQSRQRSKVAVITKQQLSFWDDVKKGAEDAGNELNMDIIYTVAEGDNDYVSQVAAVKDAVNIKHVDAIVIAPNSDTELNAVLNEAAAQNIKIITINSNLTDAGVSSFVSSSDENSGAIAARGVNSILASRGISYEKLGKIAIVGHTASTAEERIGGFIGVLSAYAERSIPQPEVPKMEDLERQAEAEAAAADEYQAKLEKFSKNIVQSPRCARRDEAKAEALKLLKTDGDGISVMFATNTVTTLGVCDAVNELGLGEKIIVVGFNSDEEELGYIRNGVLNGTVIQNPYVMGYVGVRYAKKLLDGMNIPCQLDIGATFVNGSNMNEDYIELLLNPDNF